MTTTPTVRTTAKDLHDELVQFMDRPREVGKPMFLQSEIDMLYELKYFLGALAEPPFYLNDFSTL